MIKNKCSLFQNHSKFSWKLVHYRLISIASTECCECSHPSHSRSQLNAHLALKIFGPNIPFVFLNRPIVYRHRPYLCPRVALFGANTKNPANCCASFPLKIFNAWIISPPPHAMLFPLLSNLSSQLILGSPDLSSSLEDLFINVQLHFTFFVALLYTNSSFSMSGF